MMKSIISALMVAATTACGTWEWDDCGWEWRYKVCGGGCSYMYFDDWMYQEYEVLCDDVPVC